MASLWKEKTTDGPVIMKTYYVFVDEDGKEQKSFKRYAYTTAQSGKRVLVHYKGDDTVASNTKPHIRTFPSVLRELEKSELLPSVAYKQKITVPSASHEYHSVKLPRNQKQVKNLQSRYRQRLRISHDALFNLHEIAYDFDDFVHTIVTYPDLVVVCGLKPMLVEIDGLFQLHSESFSQLLSYDTTIKMGDFYVSSLLFRNILFTKCPVMPAIFMLHERTLSTHDQLVRVVMNQLPCLANGKRVLH